MRRREPERRGGPGPGRVNRGGTSGGRRSRSRSRNRSPIRSKLMAMAMSSRGRDGRRGASRERERERDKGVGRLRMDELDDKRRGKSPVRRDGKSSTLDRVVKKAREERSNYWDKKILEAEERNPDRWGHSGYKQLYHKDKKKPERTHRSRSRSSELARKRFRSSSRSYSRSRSRSPIGRVGRFRRDSGSRSYSRSPSLSPPLKSRPTGVGGTSKALTEKRDITKRSSATATLTKSAISKKPPLGKAKNGSAGARAKRSSSISSSGSSLSRSPSRSISPRKRATTSTLAVKGKSGGRASDSFSSPSSSDEDILQIHARRGRSSSFSSMSSSSRGSHNGNVVVKRKRITLSPSSSASFSTSESDSDVSIRAKPVKKALKSAESKNEIDKPKPTDKAQGQGDGTLGAKKASKTSKNGAKTTLPSKGSLTIKANLATAKGPVSTKSKSTGKSKSGSKKGTRVPSESGETESESESDSEPRMTLSERFSKLSQLSTDKRELAKPLLSPNEMDTKMKVIKDFRNPEAPKVLVASDTNANAPLNNSSTRKTPPRLGNAESDRNRALERMYRDTPADTRLDWSDPRVRFNYYKSQGCFDERPITFDEYLKWEEWYHRYRQWLEEEEFYSRGGGRPPPPEAHGWNYGPPRRSMPGGFGPRGGMHGHGPGGPVPLMSLKRLSSPMGGGGPLSNRPHFGPPEGQAYLHVHERIGRRIERSPGGSLITLGSFKNRRGLGRP